MNIVNKIQTISSLDELSAQELADLMKYLIAHEVQPGGPYRFDNNFNPIKLNDHIYRLFASKGKILNADMLINKINSDQVSPPHQEAPSIDPVYDHILQEINLEWNRIHLDKLEGIVNKIRRADKYGEIKDQAYVFYSSLKPSLKFSGLSSAHQRQSYALANCYTWIAYTLLDEILDIKPEPRLIPLFSLLQRKINRYYLESGVSSSFIADQFNRVDQANLSELEIRGNIQQDKASRTIEIHHLDHDLAERLMYEKSIAHTLGPLWISSSVGLPEQQIMKAMQLYCSARQFNDDLHDWIDDFSDGQLTYTIVDILSELNIESGIYNYDDLLEDMQLVYWDSVLPKSCLRIKNDIKDAIMILESTALEADSEFVRLFLEPIAQSADEAMRKLAFDKNVLSKLST